MKIISNDKIFVNKITNNLKVLYDKIFFKKKINHKICENQSKHSFNEVKYSVYLFQNIYKKSQPSFFQ